MKQGGVPTAWTKTVEIPNENNAQLARVASELDELTGEGWTVQGIIQAHAARPALVILTLPRGIKMIDVEVPDQPNIAGVQIVPGNGRPTNAGPFRR